VSKIRMFLMYDDRAEEAANFYVSLFPGSRIVRVTRHGEGGPMPKGSAMAVEFELDGREFIAMNGGPYFAFSEAISLSVECGTQQEIDAYWEKLSEGGETSQCGWLKDRFGVSWQIVPDSLGTMMGGGDAARAKRVMAEMLGMQKLDLAALRAAYDGR
jgi:predicted 3-demethylubiquinone-9 3-methyltransferase (glyoxalase superfamily)